VSASDVSPMPDLIAAMDANTDPRSTSVSVVAGGADASSVAGTCAPVAAGVSTTADAFMVSPSVVSSAGASASVSSVTRVTVVVLMDSSTRRHFTPSASVYSVTYWLELDDSGAVYGSGAASVTSSAASSVAPANAGRSTS